MLEIGIEISILRDILDGKKTVEGRLGKPKFLKLRVGDEISLREDIWKDGTIVDSVPDRARIKVEQLLYFESFEEMFGSVNFKSAVPSATTVDEAIAAYRQFYSPEDEYGFGAVAIMFSLA
jgi:ASC-1-like (ASCH) protein